MCQSMLPVPALPEIGVDLSTSNGECSALCFGRIHLGLDCLGHVSGTPDCASALDATQSVS